MSCVVAGASARVGAAVRLVGVRVGASARVFGALGVAAMVAACAQEPKEPVSASFVGAPGQLGPALAAEPLGPTPPADVGPSRSRLPKGRSPSGLALRKGHRKVGRPYQIRGRTYVPKVNTSYDAKGIASWYGPKFHGKRTANGEIFDMYALSAAHPTLPLPSMVRVTNLENGKSIKVRVNDRGPYAHNRIIDLSKRAAERLDFKAAGTARVRVQYLKEAKLDPAYGLQDKVEHTAKRSVDPLGTLARVTGIQLARSTGARPPATVPAGRTAQGPKGTGFTVVAGTFSNRANAERLARDLSGLGPVRIVPVVGGGRSLARVEIGPFVERRAAETVQRRAILNGLRDARIQHHS